MQERLPAAMLDALRQAAALTTARGLALYLVGGSVRDLLLDRPHLDLDVTVVGNAGELAAALAVALGGRVVAHPQFGTAVVTWDGHSLDVVTARAEHYPHPGALPVVRPGDLRDDLLRRDFTINTLAVRLDGPHWGHLVDLTGGLADLQGGVVRALHARSFQDDPTRMLRAVRYEQRLDFHLEPETEAWLRRDAGMVAAVSGDRLRRELVLILEEDQPEQALLRAEALGLLRAVHPALRMSPETAAAFAQARAEVAPERPAVALSWCLLTYDNGPEERAVLASRLRLPGDVVRALDDFARLQERLPALAAPDLRPSAITSLLDGLADAALLAGAIRTDTATVRCRIRQYRREWRQVRPLLTGRDVQDLGVPRGPLVGHVLAQLRAARLDGLLATHEDEVQQVRGWLAAQNPSGRQDGGSVRGEPVEPP